MNKLKRLLTVVCVLTLVLTLSTGCGKTEDVQKTQGTPDTTAAAAVPDTVTPPASPDPVTLRFSWWGGDARHKATLEAIDLYMKNNSHVTIEAEYGGYSEYYQKLVTQLAGGAAPDVMQVDSIWIADLYKQDELFVDLYTLPEIDISGIDKTFLKDFCEIDGKLQGIPKSITTVTFICNMDFFKKFSIDVNTKLDWDNMLDIGTKVHQQDPESYLIEPHFGMMKNLILSYMKQKDGNNLITDDYSLGHDKAVITEALIYFRKLIDNGVVVPYEDAATIAEADERLSWQNGKSGVIYNFDGTIGKIKGNSTSELGIILPPIMADAKDTGITIKPGVLTCINSKTENLEECTKFMNFYNNDKDALLVLGDSRGVPPTTEATQILVDGNKIDPLLSVALEKGKANAGSPVNANSNNAEIDKILQDIINEVGFKSKTAEKAAEELVPRLEAKLLEIKSSMK